MATGIPQVDADRQVIAKLQQITRSAARVFTGHLPDSSACRPAHAQRSSRTGPVKALPSPRTPARSVEPGDAFRNGTNCGPCWFLLASVTMMRTYKSFGLAVAVLLAGVSTSFGAAVIGNTSDGTSTDGLRSNGAWINTCRFQAASNMTVVTMHAKVAAITGRVQVRDLQLTAAV